MKRTYRYILTALTAIVMTLEMGMTAFASFDYNKSVDEIAASPLTAYNTVYLGMPRADFGANFALLPDWKFYGSSISYQERAERSTVKNSIPVTEGIQIFTANPSASGKVLAFDSYFKTADKKTAKDIYTRLMATIYSNMENFPQRQSSSSVTWVQNDVTIAVSYTEQKDEDGQYVVLIRRYNNHVLG